MKHLVVATLLTTLAQTASVSYAFNDQLPPQAQVGQSYSYQFASDTFSGTSLIYSASDLPSWLSFDNTTRTLSGTPTGTSGNSYVNFLLEATDSTSTAQCNCTLLVTSTDPPTIAGSLVSTLKTAGSISSNDSLVLSPGSSFNLTFPSDYFAASSGHSLVGYSATTSSHSPLPIWISFDEDTLSFTGTAPTINSAIAPSVGYSFTLWSIEFQGYASTGQDFVIQVGAHSFTTNLTIDNINATEGSSVTYQLPLVDMSLDNRPLQVANISSISTNSTFLTVDKSTASLVGTVPSKKETEYVLVDIFDTYLDSISYIVALQVLSNTTEIFTQSSLGNVNATRGEYFSFSFAKYLTDKSANISLTVDPSSDSSWISYIASNHSVQGTVPSDFSKATVTLSGTEGGSSDTTSFTLQGIAKAVVTATSSSTTKSSTATSSATASPTASSTASPTPTTAAANSSKSGISHGTLVKILCGVLIPVGVLLLLLLALCLFCCCRRKNEKKDKKNIRMIPTHEPDPEKGDDMVMVTKLHSSGSNEGTSTAVGTPVSPVFAPDTPNGGEGSAKFPKFAPPNDYESPHRVSTMNFARLDSGDRDDTTPVNNGQAYTAEKPLRSWRENRRDLTSAEMKGWQDHPSNGGSIATISTDELLTMRLVDPNSTGSSTPNAESNNGTTVPPNRGLPRDQSSDNFIHPVGTRSTNAPSRSESMATANRTTPLSEEIPPVPHAPYTNFNNERGSPASEYVTPSIGSASAFATPPLHRKSSLARSLSDSESDHYRTASSGSDNDIPLRAYRNSHGQVTWTQLIADEDREAERLRENEDNRSSVSTAKLGNVDKRRTLSQSARGGDHDINKSISAELAFI